MTPEKYKRMIAGSGGFTKGVRRGDRPRPLSLGDESALDQAWRKAATAPKSSSENETVKKTRPPGYVKT